MAHLALSSSITYKWTFDVFLSFHGEDTRLGFTSHLYRSLRQSGIHAFLDDEFIRIGENITPALFEAIQKSRIAIIVFSENYANSTFCLQELEKILECFKEQNRLIYPVFCYVDPSELRRPRGSYAAALARLEERFKDNPHKVEKWRLALSQAADLRGCHLKPKIANEQEFITRITNVVAARINRLPLYVAKYPVGLEARAKRVISRLHLWSTKEIKMIGIWGAGGIGKSTIARAVYNSIADNFEGSYFSPSVRKDSKMPHGLSHLQETLLRELVMEKDLKLNDYHEGIPIIEHRLGQKKILLILDDVDELNQLEALAGSCNWFGCGSRIIITTRDKQLLVCHDVTSIYEVEELNYKESLKLLSWCAFKKENVDSNNMEACNRAIRYSCGFPLVLELIASKLCGKRVDLWSSALDRLKSTPHQRVLDALKLSYDSLERVEKQVFLDLACFFNGGKLAYVNHILHCVRGIQQPEYVIEVLIDKSLIKLEQDLVTMHDSIEDAGKEIVRQESSYQLSKQSRLWSYQDILQVLEQDNGTNKIEAIILDLPENIEVQWSGEAFVEMKSLKMLVIKQACFSECPKYLPKSLRWLEWKGYSFKFFPSLCATELVSLDLSFSSCELLQPFDKKFRNLSSMKLTNCKSLQQIPDLSGASNIRELCLDGCTNLIEIHDSVGCLNKLREWSAMRCKNLKILPSCLRLTSLEHLNLFGCSSLQRFPEVSILMEEMQTLDLDKTAIIELPSSICNLIGLRVLSMEECPNLMQLPASICTLPNLWKLTANSCEQMSHFKKCEGGDEATNLDCSHIGGMPPNLEKFSAICCSSLTELSKIKVLEQAINFQCGKKNFILPGEKFPKGLHKYDWGNSVSIWVRDVLPTTFLWILVKDVQDYVYNCEFSVHINEETKLEICIKHESESYGDLEILEAGGYKGTTYARGHSYDNLTELRLTDCNRCRSIPALGQLPALRSLTIETLRSLVAVGSEFSKADDWASLIPFPSLETLKRLGIQRCPLLASSIPKCPIIQKIAIIKSPNVALQEQELPPSLRRLAISGGHGLGSLSVELHIEDLIVWDCSDAVPPPLIHIPPSVKQLIIGGCENLNAFRVPKAPLVHVRKISLYYCKFLTSLFDNMECLLPNLEKLKIKGCPKMEPFSPGLLPSSLKQLKIRECDKLLSCHAKWHHLPTIIKLVISTDSDTLHCIGLQHLTSLQQLELRYSDKLEKIEGGMMPPSLLKLRIRDCPLLEERCLDKDEEIWPKISHVPYISLNGRRLRAYLEDQDMNDATILEDQAIFEDLQDNDATIQVQQSPSPSRSER
ncbi:TMV resistance protein N-like [Neltuma alba]|uniref:TMV resistance protein N-like n=1 Tax=Neltuma alba TaxID=207710 RepID=UPI0010A580EE|nr:TMV resistance protein N-like [Prosopis alba]